jgi:hypothetical protein
MVPDRIPPRVDTPVTLTFSGTPDVSAPVEVRVEGGGGANGAATINGGTSHNFAVTGAQTINLRGTTQTAPGSAGNLRLVARQRGTELARSSGFSVSSIPQNVNFAFSSPITGTNRGFVALGTWQSDSGNITDLDQTDISERVQISTATGSLAGVTLTTSGYLGVGTTSLLDTHSVGPTSVLTSAGNLILEQTQMFKDLRAGAVDIPVTNSGFRIAHLVFPKPGTGFLGIGVSFQVLSMKFGAATTALGVRSGAGSGIIIRPQDV